jgi:hypothetical protein
MSYTGPPIERVTLEFLVLLSMFARELLVPLGLRRVSNTPIVETPHYHSPLRRDRASTPPPFGINSPEFISLITGFAQAPEDMAQALLAATKFYQSGLALIAVDPSIAYTSLVSAIECLAGYHYYDQRFEFEEVDKFRGARHILERISALPQAADFSVVLFRPTFMLFFEKNRMKVHTNQWLLTLPYPLERLAGATSRGQTMAPEGQKPSKWICLTKLPRAMYS